MNADMEKAVEYCSQIFDGCDNGEWALVKQALRDQEAEIARLKDAVAKLEGEHSLTLIRAGSAEAQLRSEVALLRAWARESREGGWSTHQVDPMNRRADEIAAHLGATHDHP